ncbi:MAG: winged helix-turn-helix domain-containing protein [Candidatus Binatia bacterium]
MDHSRSLSFSPFRLASVEGRLYRETNVIPLRPKTYTLLYYLVTHAGDLVSKETLLNSIWPDTIVSEGGLTELMRELRKVLGDIPHTPRFIETVHGRGYRFIAKVYSPESRIPSLESEKHRDAPREQTRDAGRQTEDIPFVGRETELAQLHGWLAKARRGERQLVFVTGEPGIGKTTVVEAFLQQISTDSKVRVSRGQCIEQYGASEAYLPVLEALGRLARQAEGSILVSVL